MFSRIFVMVFITLPRDVYLHYYVIVSMTFGRDEPQEEHDLPSFDCLAIHDFLVYFLCRGRGSYPDGLFSHDSLVDPSFEMMMDSSSRAF